MEIQESMNRFYIKLAVSDLHRTNGKSICMGLSYNSLVYLSIIDRTPDCTASKLAEITDVSRPAIAAKIRELLAEGVIEKKQSREDGRIYHLSVTPKIMREYRLYDESFHRAAEEVKEKFSKKDVRTFCRILDALGEIQGRIAEEESGKSSGAEEE